MSPFNLADLFSPRIWSSLKPITYRVINLEHQLRTLSNRIERLPQELSVTDTALNE